jgi:hypothetical protein
MRRLIQRDVFLLTLILLVVTLLALPILTYPLGRDQGEFATIGRGLLNGRVPYTELWNPKPPAVFYVYALAIRLLGETAAALRAIDLLIAPLTSVALFWLGRRIANRWVGLWAALIFPVFYFTETFWTLTQNDGIALLPMTLAMACLFETLPHSSSPQALERGSNTAVKSPLHAMGRGFGGGDNERQAKVLRLFWAFLAGALSAYVVWFKYPFALFGLAVVGGYGLVYRSSFPIGARPLHPSTHLKVVKTALAFALGGLVVGGGGALYLMAIGVWDALVESARVTSQYTALTFNAQDFGQLMNTALGFRWMQWGTLWVLAAAWFIVTRWDEQRGPGWRVVLLWALAGLGIMLIQAKGYDYHWLPLLPPLTLLAADAVDRLTQMLTRLLSGVILAAAKINAVVNTLAAGGLLCILAAGIWPRVWPYLTGQEDQATYYRHFVAGEFVADESLQVAKLLRERVVPGDSLFIWGFRPEVYYLSRLNPASRFIFHFPLVGVWYPAAWRQEAVETLWAAMPPYVLVLQVDYMPWVTGSPDDSNTLLQGYTELNNWLIHNYERETQIGNFFVWRRKAKP